MTTVSNVQTPAAAPDGSAALNSLSANFGNFLRLLMTQLKNQDPSSPMDANAFTSELVQFSSVEQQIQTNSSLNQLIQLTQASNVTQSAGILGKQVTVRSTQMPLQNGTGTLKFTAPAAGPVTVTVQNQNGGPLKQVTVNAMKGVNNWTWDGTAANGQTVPDGAYGVRVATAATGQTAAALPFTVAGTATGVSTGDGTVNLQLGSLTVPFSAVTLVGN